MKLSQKEFIDILEDECLDSNNINFSITLAKGIITLFWSHTFLEKSNLENFLDKKSEIDWANMKLNYLEEKYNNFHIKTKQLKEDDVIDFDKRYNPQKEAPVKKSWRTDTQSFGGFIQFDVK